MIIWQFWKQITNTISTNALLKQGYLSITLKLLANTLVWLFVYFNLQNFHDMIIYYTLKIDSYVYFSRTRFIAPRVHNIYKLYLYVLWTLDSTILWNSYFGSNRLITSLVLSKSVLEISVCIFDSSGEQILLAISSFSSRVMPYSWGITRSARCIDWMYRSWATLRPRWLQDSWSIIITVHELLQWLLTIPVV